MTAFLAQIARLNPQLNAIVARLDDDACLALADKADAALGNGEADRPAARPADRLQGSRAGRRLSAEQGFAALQDIHARSGFGARRTHPPRRRDSDRKDERSGVRDGLADLQHGLRHDAQSLRSQQDRRRIERRRGGRARHRHAANRRRRRPRRIASQSRELQQHRRAAAQRRARAGRAVADSVRRRVDEGRDGAIGRATSRLA